MGVEIERKFLVKDDSWRKEVESTEIIQQAYISKDNGTVVRVRLVNEGEGYYALLTIKGKAQGISKPEYEYDIPHRDAIELIATMQKDHMVEKHRHFVNDGFVVDEFINSNHGLVIAEIELENEEQEFERPLWLGEEVSNDMRYANSNLSTHPFKFWKDENL